MSSQMKLHRLDDHYSREILTKIRDRETGREEFRWGLRRLGMLTGIRIAATMGYSDVEVETPLGVQGEGRITHRGAQRRHYKRPPGRYAAR